MPRDDRYADLGVLQGRCANDALQTLPRTRTTNKNLHSFGRQVHLGVGSIGRALGIEVVEKVGLSVFPLNSRCDVTYVAFVGDLFFGVTIVFICRSGGCEGNAQGQGDPRVLKRSDFHRFGSTVNVARACRRLKWVGIQPVGWRSIPAASVPRRKKSA